MPAPRHRITKGEEYRSTVRSGRRVGGAFCITHAVLRSQEEPARFGYIISKAVSKKAVTRNLMRRRLKTISERRLHDGLQGIDLVFRVLPAAAEASFADLEREVNRAIDRAIRPPHDHQQKSAP